MIPHLQGSTGGSRFASHNAVHSYTVNYNTTGISSGVLVDRISASATQPVIVRVGYQVNTAFNAGTTNVLTAGTSTTATEWLDADATAEGVTAIAGPRVAGYVYFDNPIAATTTGSITQYDLTGGAGTAAGPISPAHARNVILNLTDANASISAFSITVHGTNIMGDTISENFVFAGGLDQTGVNAFQTITSVVIDSVTGAGAGDTLDLGLGVKMGVPFGPNWSVTKQLKTGAAETPSATNSTYGTVTFGTAPDATLDFGVFYKYNLPMPLMKTFRLTADTDVYVKYTQTGTAATTGSATFILEEFEENVTAIA